MGRWTRRINALINSTKGKKIHIYFQSEIIIFFRNIKLLLFNKIDHKYQGWIEE